MKRCRSRRGTARFPAGRWSKSGRDFGEEAVEPGGGALAHGQHPALAVLALADHQGAGGGIVVAVVEVGHFAAPDAGSIEEFEDGAVAQAEGIGGVGDGEEALDFLFVEGFGQAAGLLARQVEIGGGIGGNGAGAAKPGEEAPHAAEPGELGVDDQRLSGAGAAVVVEVDLIGADGGAGEDAGRVVPLGVRPSRQTP